MKKASKPKIDIDTSESNWHNLIGYNLCDMRSLMAVAERRAAPGQNPAELMQKLERQRDALWPEVFDQADGDNFVRRTAPVLIATGFFEKTKYKGLALFSWAKFCWDMDPNIKISVHDGEVWAIHEMQPENFAYLSGEQFLDILTGLAAEAMIAVCDKYKLDARPALELAEKYPVPKIEFSLFSPKIAEPSSPHPTGYKSAPLTAEELLVTPTNTYQWCVQAPFTDANLAKIGPDTLTVIVPCALTADVYEKIAKAMTKAPKAIVLFQHTDALDTVKSVVKYFSHVERAALGSRRLAEVLPELSPHMISLDLSIADADDLALIKRFESLELLQLDGQPISITWLPELPNLRALGLNRVRIKNLDCLKHLHNLQSLAISDSTIDNTAALSKVGHLKYISLKNLAKLTELDDLQVCENLEYLHLHNLKNIGEIPSLKRLTALRRLSITDLKSLVDLSGIVDAPNLEELIIFDMKHLTAAHVEILKDSKSLKALRTDNFRIEKTLNWPRTGTGSLFKLSPHTQINESHTNAPKITG